MFVSQSRQSGLTEMDKIWVRDRLKSDTIPEKSRWVKFFMTFYRVSDIYESSKASDMTQRFHNYLLAETVCDRYTLKLKSFLIGQSVMKPFGTFLYMCFWSEH